MSCKTDYRCVPMLKMAMSYVQAGSLSLHLHPDTFSIKFTRHSKVTMQSATAKAANAGAAASGRITCGLLGRKTGLSSSGSVRADMCHVEEG
jgi:hypothetical protein